MSALDMLGGVDALRSVGVLAMLRVAARIFSFLQKNKGKIISDIS